MVHSKQGGAYLRGPTRQEAAQAQTDASKGREAEFVWQPGTNAGRRGGMMDLETLKN